MDEMNFNKALYEEIGEEFEQLKNIQVGSPECKTAVEGLTRLMDKAIEIKKLDIEQKNHDEERKKAEKEAKIEQEMKLKQMEEDKKDRLVKNIISVAGIVVPVVVAMVTLNKSLKFEETGSYTTMSGRSIIGRIFSKIY